MSDNTAHPSAWHTLSNEAVVQQLAVDPAQGLRQSEVEQRLGQYGPNVLTEAKEEPLWRASTSGKIALI